MTSLKTDTQVTTAGAPLVSSFSCRLSRLTLSSIMSAEEHPGANSGRAAARGSEDYQIGQIGKPRTQACKYYTNHWQTI